MPVIRSEVDSTPISSTRRASVVDQFVGELSGQTSPGGPVIFEIELDQTGRFDVLAVWDDWAPFASEERSDIILDAYGENRSRIAQALGVTYQEAMQQELLPYAVIPMVKRAEVDLESLRTAMIEQGGVIIGSHKLELRFPTMSLAEQAHRRLTDKLSKGYWSIVQTVASIT